LNREGFLSKRRRFKVINYENCLWPLIYDQYNRGRHEKEFSFYYEELKQRNGKVLEIACGTGMILLKMLIVGMQIKQQSLPGADVQGLAVFTYKNFV